MNYQFVSFIESLEKYLKRMLLAECKSPGQIACSQSLCQNSGTCQEQGVSAGCMCRISTPSIFIYINIDGELILHM